MLYKGETKKLNNNVVQFSAGLHLMFIKQKDMENKISIPKPCHEDWNAMLPEAQGKHCLSCSKTVIDFSTWEPEDILTYLQKRNTERVCGRFDTRQVAIEMPAREELLENVVRAHMPLLRKIAAVIVVCFGLYVGDTQAQEQHHIVGKPAYGHTQNTIKGEPALADTAKVAVDTTYRPQIMGMIAMPPKEIHKEKKPVKGKGSVKKKTK